MHKIFLCHASEDKPLAERIQLALVTAGHKVFYDEQSLPPGGDFHARIQQAILECDLFIFLISSNSIAPGKFTLTELKFARERWPSPVGRVLPVNLQNLPTKEVPAYLTAATLLSVAGNPASEVRAAAEKMLAIAAKKKPRRMAITIAVGSVALTLSVIVWRFDPTGSLPGPRPTPTVMKILKKGTITHVATDVAKHEEQCIEPPDGWKLVVESVKIDPRVGATHPRPWGARVTSADSARACFDIWLSRYSTDVASVEWAISANAIEALRERP